MNFNLLQILHDHKLTFFYLTLFDLLFDPYWTLTWHRLNSDLIITKKISVLHLVNHGLHFVNVQTVYPVVQITNPKDLAENKKTDKSNDVT